MTNEQKVKFLGTSRQIFHVGRRSFPSNVWLTVTPDELATLSQDNVRPLFAFDPPLVEVEVVAIEGPVVGEEKPKRRRRRKKDESEENNANMQGG